MLMCSPLRRFPLLPQVGKICWRGVLRGAEWRPWATCGVRGCLGHPSTLGKSNGAVLELSSRALWLAAWCSDPFAGPAGRRRAGLEPRPRRADAEQRSCGGAGGSTRRLGRLAAAAVWCAALLGALNSVFLLYFPLIPLSSSEDYAAAQPCATLFVACRLPSAAHHRRPVVWAD